jgi:hypothetical protein
MAITLQPNFYQTTVIESVFKFSETINFHHDPICFG